jgi:anti-sigma B factor antagonist
MSIAQVPPDLVVGRADAVPSSFACSCTDGDLQAAWVRVAGELDMATAPELERTLREAQSRARLVVLDLRELTFTDLSGVHAIVDASIRAREIDRRLVVLRAPPDVDRTFQLVRSGNEVEIGDIESIEPPASAPQRSLGSLSLLRTGEHPRRRGRLH